MSYSAFGSDPQCVGKKVGASCAPRSHCDGDLICVCDDQYGVHPVSGDCVTSSELCSYGTQWSTLRNACVAVGSSGLPPWVELTAWAGGGIALGLGVLFLVFYQKKPTAKGWTR